MVMDYAQIAKDVTSLRVTPHMRDYEETCANWSWDAVRAELDRPGGLVNQAHECIDRHALGARRDKVAMIWEAASGAIERHTFDDMRRQSNRFANVLAAHGLARGDRLAVLLALFVTWGWFRSSPHVLTIFFFLFLATLSHSLLDALTNGGLGVALLAPFTPERLKAGFA